MIANADLKAHATEKNAGTEKIGTGAIYSPEVIEAAYRDACRRVDEVVSRLQQPPVKPLGEIDPRGPLELKFTSNMTQGQYEDAVRKGMEYIKAGDIFQFVP